MTWLRGGMRLRETRLWGLTLGLIYYPPQALTQRGFKLVFYDPSDVKVGEIGSDVLAGRASSVEFELMDFGCGAWSLTLEDRPGFNIGYRTRIDIHPYFSDVPWFSGFVQNRPKEGTARPVVYSGFGFYEQLDWVRVTDSYAALDIAEIVKDIVEHTVAPNTQIIYNAAKIETTGYVVNSMNFDHTPAKDAIQTLAEIAQNFEYGVDNLREFYFRAVSTEVQKHFWTGKHLADNDIDEDPKPIRNRLYVKVGQIQAGGTNYIGSVEDGDSIFAHGLREDEITAPEILDGDDALQWAGYKLSEKKDPLVRADLRDIFLDDTKAKIDAIGKVRITTAKGTEYTLAIKRVKYKIGVGGILADIELGQIFIPFERHIVNLLQRVTDEQRLGDQRTTQLYGGGGEGPADMSYWRHAGADNYDAWYSSPTLIASTATGALASNRIYATPFICPKSITLDRIAIRVTVTGSPMYGRLGIYSDDGNAFPGALLLDAGEFYIAVGANQITINQALPGPALYWLVFITDSTPTAQLITYSHRLAVLGFTAALSAYNVAFFKSHTYGPLPATFPTPVENIGAGAFPAILVRLSA